MTVEELFELFEGHDEFLKFERVSDERRLSNRPDLCAFLLLDKLVPGKSDIVTSAEHDQIWLHVGVDELAAVVAPEDVVTLQRCGVMLDSETESLSMFV